MLREKGLRQLAINVTEFFGSAPKFCGKQKDTSRLRHKSRDAKQECEAGSRDHPRENIATTARSSPFNKCQQLPRKPFRTFPVKRMSCLRICGKARLCQRLNQQILIRPAEDGILLPQTTSVGTRIFFNSSTGSRCPCASHARSTPALVAPPPPTPQNSAPAPDSRSCSPESPARRCRG